MNLKRFSQALSLPLVATAVSIIFISGFALAGEPTDQLKSGIDNVLKILRDPNLRGSEKKAERRAKLRTTIGEKFDFAEMARRSLATHWRNRNKKEKEEFVDLFSGLLASAYISKIEAYTDEKILYTKERADNEFAQVNTAIVTKDKSEIQIIYRMHKVDGRWMVYDVVIEGVSLVKYYRDQFNSILRKASYDDLVKKLREKQGEG